MHFEDDLSEKEVHAEWNRLQSAIEKKQAEEPEIKEIPSINWKKYISIAAAIAVVLLVSALLINQPSYTIHTTAYGEQQRIKLPDGSLAVLNSNSSLRFKSNWLKNDFREVEIKGEAFFSVVHTPDDEQFFVRTGEGMLVEALGTEFNVYERRGMQRVVLNSGSARLRYESQENNAPIMMDPGEMVIRKSPEAAPEKMKVNTSLYSAWVKGQLIFENTPLAEVCRVIADNFGITIVLPGIVLNNRLFNGTFPAGNAEILVKTLMATYDLESIRSDGVIKLIKK